MPVGDGSLIAADYAWPVRSRLRPPLPDALLALVLAAAAQLQLWTVDTIHGPAAVQSALLLAATLPLAWLRRGPSTILLVICGALGVQAALGSPSDAIGAFLALLVALFTTAAYARQGPALGSLVAASAVIAYHLARDPSARNPFVLAIEVAVAVLVVVAGLAVREREYRLQQAVAHAERLRESQAAELERARSEERLKISREMHDIIANSVSVMVLQAGAARQALSRDADEAAGPLRLVEETGRETLSDLRRLLGVLREQPGTRDLEPPPGLDRMDELLAKARSAGIDVTTRIEGTPRHMAGSIDLAAYRVLQEGLTNVMTHASEDRVLVVVTYGERCLGVSVTNHGRDRVRSEDTGGHGLIGLEERVGLLGGAFEAGPRKGGFEVRATLPLGGEQ